MDVEKILAEGKVLLETLSSCTLSTLYKSAEFYSFQVLFILLKEVHRLFLKWRRGLLHIFTFKFLRVDLLKAQTHHLVLLLVILVC